MTARTEPPSSCAHRWRALSRHRVSDGTVVYEGCRCGRVRILQLVEVAVAAVG